jgi:uncharacterized membrane protein YkvA (DUF1232 family)
MAEKDNRNLLIPPQGGMFRDLALRLKLIWNLMTDKRVNIFLKLIPIASLAYLIWPIDLISVIPGLSALDDAAIVSLGAYMFIELCPPNIVKEYVKQLTTSSDLEDDGEIVDADVTDIQE